MEFQTPSLTINIVLRGSVAAQPFLVWGEKDGGVLVADEALQCHIVVLGMLIEAFLQAW